MQHILFDNSEEEERKWVGTIFEDTVTENFLEMMEDINFILQKLENSQLG